MTPKAPLSACCLATISNIVDDSPLGGTGYMKCDRCGRGCDPAPCEDIIGNVTSSSIPTMRRVETQQPSSAGGGESFSPDSGDAAERNKAEPSPAVQKPSDIIGIVKELRQLAKNATEGDWRIETNSHGLKQDIMAPTGLVGEYWSDQDAEFIVAVRKHFPSIAQALLEREEKLKSFETTLTHLRHLQDSNASLTEKIHGLEEKLRIAVEGLEKMDKAYLEKATGPGSLTCSLAGQQHITICNALSRIQSLS